MNDNKVLLDIKDDKEISFFINTLNNVNQIMKTIDILSDGTTDDVIDKVPYLIENFHFDCVAIKSKATPRELYLYDIKFNKKQLEYIDRWDNEVPNMNLILVEDPIELYKFIKDNKKYINRIQIFKYYVIFGNYNEVKNEYLCNYKLPLRNRDNINDIIDDINECNKDSTCTITLSNEHNKDTYNDFINHKGIFNLYLYYNDNLASINEDKYPTKDKVIFIISSKYIKGLSGIKSDKSKIEIIIEEVKDIENLLKIDIVIYNNGKMVIENLYNILQIE